MKHFDFVEFFYDSLNGMTNEQRGQFITIMCEYYFNGKTKFADMDKTVMGAANVCINYNKKQNPSDEWELRKAQSKEVLNYIKENNLIICIKFGNIADHKQEIYDALSHIPHNVIDSTITWVKDKYEFNFPVNENK